MRQLVREQRCGQLARRRRLPRREQRNQAARAVDQLQVGDQIPQLLEIAARKQRFAFDHDQHIEFRCRKTLGLRFVLLVVLGIGAEQLAQRIVDLDALDAEDRTDDQGDENHAGQHRRPDRDQADALQPESDAQPLWRLLDLVGMDLTVAVLFEHGLSDSHISSICIA